MALVRRGDRWGVRVWQDGKHRWLGTYPTRTEARRAEADATLKPAVAGSYTVQEWAEAWLRDYARTAVATRRTYRYATQTIVRDLGTKKLAAITRPEAKRVANTWPRNTTGVARTMFADALRDGLCQHNPFTNLRLERSQGRRHIVALTEPEIGELADLARSIHGDYGDEAAAIILFAAYTGIRPGELAALRWSDLRPAEQEATISRALDGQGGLKAPKNGKARRIILPPQALHALSLVARSLDDEEYVFRTPRGRRFNKGNMNYVWRPVCAAWRARGGRDMDFYELRHACATLLLERGLSPADVAVQLGHSDGGALVMAVYGHPSEDLARDRLRMAFAVGDSVAVVERGRAQGRAS